MPLSMLISPFMAVLGVLDAQATAAPVGGFDSGYDPDFREPRRLPAADQEGVSTRVETVLRIRCQVETEKQNRLDPGTGGDTPKSVYTLVLLIRDLEELGLIDPDTGNPTLKKQDRLESIETLSGEVVQTFDDPPGLYVHEVRTDSYGMSLLAPRPQLAIVEFVARDLTTGASG